MVGDVEVLARGGADAFHLRDRVGVLGQLSEVLGQIEQHPCPLLLNFGCAVSDEKVVLSSIPNVVGLRHVEVEQLSHVQGGHAVGRCVGVGERDVVHPVVGEGRHACILRPEGGSLISGVADGLQLVFVHPLQCVRESD